MKNILFVILFIYSSFFFHSCSKEEDISTPSIPTIEKPIDPDVEKVQIVAKMVSELTGDPGILSEVKSGVESNLTYGQDEILRFTDILNPKQNLTLKSSGNSKLAARLSQMLNSNHLKSSSTNNLETFILNENVQIYWPYSENWDGITEPVVTFNPANGNNWNYGYSKTGNNEYILDKNIIVDENYARNHPVWIINQSETDDDDLPNFSDGESFKNGIKYICAADSVIPEQSGLRASGEPVYVLRLGKFMASRQYDDFFNGGSEFAIQLGKGIAGTTEKNSTVEITYLKICRSRKDISNRRWIDVNAILNSGWTDDQISCAFKIHEEDQGGTKFWNPDIDIKLLKKDIIRLKANIPYGSGDDQIYQVLYKKDFIFSSANIQNLYSKEWPIHTESSVNWTLPWNVTYTLR